MARLHGGRRNETTSEVVLQSLQGRERRTLGAWSDPGRYVGTGHLATHRAAGVRRLVRPRSSRCFGQPAEIVAGVSLGRDGIEAQFDVSDEGTLGDLSGVKVDERTLAWVNRQGRSTALQATPRGYHFPSLAPAGRTLAVNVPMERGRIVAVSARHQDTVPLTSTAS